MSEKRYRDLEAGETIQEGDYFKYRSNIAWYPVDSRHIGKKLHRNDVGLFRRPIAEPTDKDSLTVENEESPSIRLGKFLRDEGIPLKPYKPENGVEVGTLRVDAIVAEYTVPEDAVIPVDFARQLERELNKTIARREVLHGRLLECVNEVEQAEKERDEWREIAVKLAIIAKTNVNSHGCTCSVCEQDEAETEAALAAYELKAKEGA